VINYPKDIKAFYMRVNDDGRTVAAMDALAPGIGEIIGSSQREERLEVLDRSMAERGIDQEHYAWYRDLRSHGTVPHAGFGLAPAFAGGTLAYVTGLANVPRDPIPANPRQRAVLMRPPQRSRLRSPPVGARRLWSCNCPSRLSVCSECHR
jgi:asparaginyl-tRNA synthetase